MKYIPAIQRLRNDPEALLVVVDDDKVYPPTLIAGEQGQTRGQPPPCSVTISSWMSP